MFTVCTHFEAKGRNWEAFESDATSLVPKYIICRHNRLQRYKRTCERCIGKEL